MLARMQVKRAIKAGAGLASVATRPFFRSQPDDGCIFAYHRVADLGFLDPQVDDWNVAPSMFERQLVAILNCADIVPLTDLLAGSESATARRPRVALTFDDGYANFHTQVLPLLKRYQAPATVFVVTSMIDSNQPIPYDAWSVKHGSSANADAWRHMNWRELDECIESGLVSVGGHSHRHLKAPTCSRELLAEEAGRSMEILRSRFGDVPAYAYPYGCSRLGHVPSSYVEAVVAAGYRCAVTFDLGRVNADTDRYRMPRIEAHGTDGPSVIRAKILASLGPYRLTDRLRQAERAV